MFLRDCKELYLATKSKTIINPYPILDNAYLGRNFGKQGILLNLLGYTSYTVEFMILRGNK